MVNQLSVIWKRKPPQAPTESRGVLLDKKTSIDEIRNSRNDECWGCSTLWNVEWALHIPNIDAYSVSDVPGKTKTNLLKPQQMPAKYTTHEKAFFHYVSWFLYDPLGNSLGGGQVVKALGPGRVGNAKAKVTSCLQARPHQILLKYAVQNMCFHSG